MQSSATWNMFCDGASRGNPGPASTGVVLYDESGAVLFEHGKYLGKMTNNEAEYNALLEGVELSLNLIDQNRKPPRLNIFMDSELVVKQIKGQYKVKNERLKVLHEKIKSLLKDISYNIQHVPREKNKAADALANKVLDQTVLS